MRATTTRFLAKNVQVGTSKVAPMAAAQRQFSKVAVIGAAGGIGQPTALLMKMSPLVTELRCYDVAPVTPGVATDLSHINTGAKVTGYAGGEEALLQALDGVDVVICPAGVPRKPGMTRDDLFNINAGIVADISKSVAKACPEAALCIISNPVNSTVPIAAEILRRAGVFNPNKLFGVTSLDVVRANTFIAEHQGLNVGDMDVTVVGGHAGVTILPLLSHIKGANFTQEDKEKLTHRIMFGGDDVVQAKAGGGSATLSMAWAGAYFANNVLTALSGEQIAAPICAYVQSDKTPVSFFSTPLELGRDGISKIGDLPAMDDYEQSLFETALPELESSIAKGLEFAKNYQM